MKEKRLKMIRTLGNRIEAEIIKSFLSANGIVSEIFADDANQSYPSLSSVRGVNIYVKEDDYEDAISLLERFDEKK